MDQPSLFFVNCEKKNLKMGFFIFLSHTFAIKASANLLHCGESFGTTCSRDYFVCLKYKSFCYQSFSGHGLYRKCVRQVTLRFYAFGFFFSTSYPTFFWRMSVNQLIKPELSERQHSSPAATI